MKKLVVLVLIGTSIFQACRNDDKEILLLSKAEIPYMIGESRTVIDPCPGPDYDSLKWYTNDHCFVTDHEGTLHWFGINNPYPPEGKRLYRYHPYLGHLTTDNPLGPWQRTSFALDESRGTEYLGAPYVIWHEESGRWTMVLQTNFDTVFGLEVCWSHDLYSWERTRTPILPGTLWSATRDPHIMKGKDGKYWIHCLSSNVNGLKQSQVIRIKTKDFVSFDDPEIIMAIEEYVTAVESPFVLERNGLWYLFCTYAHRRYEETLVIVSNNPDHFDYKKNCLTTLFGHAAEIFTFENKTYISSCGPEDTQRLNLHGVTVAELGWLRQK